MAFAGTAASPLNFRQAWSAETTLAFLRRLTIGARLNAQWDGDAMTNAQVFVQNPNYNVVASQTTRKQAYGTPREPEASRITIDMNQNARVENMLYVEDEVQNAVRTYRARLQTASISALATHYEDNIVSYMASLATTGAATVNGFAGPIGVMNFAGDKDTGFAPVSGKPFGSDAQKADALSWLEDFLTTARVQFERADIPIGDGGPGNGGTIGGGTGNFWCVLPPELYAHGLAAALEAKGISLDFVRQVIQSLGVFGPTFGGSYKGFDLIVSNALPNPADHDTDWVAYAGADAAIAAPRRPVRNYVTEPANASAERYEFRHMTTFGRALINSDLLIKGVFNTADGTSP